MKWYILFFILIFGASCCKSDTLKECDSIRIIGFKEYDLSPFTIGRAIFFDAVKQDLEGAIDTTLVQKTKINSIITNINKLQIASKLNVDTYHIDYKYNEKGTRIEQNSLNNLLCLLLYRGNDSEIIWIGRFMLDRNTSRYYLSPSLMKTLSEYTNIFGDCSGQEMK